MIRGSATITWASALGLLLLLAPTLWAAQNSNIDIGINPQTIYTTGSSTISATFYFRNQSDGLDAPQIDQVDAYLLDLSESGASIQNVSGNGWQHEFITLYGDDHFWIRNAWDQNLTVNLTFNQTLEGSYPIRGYYQFFDDEGGTTGLGDNRAFYPLVDNVDHTAIIFVVDKTNPTVSLKNPPTLVSNGLRVDGNVIETNPLSSLTISYTGAAGNGSITYDVSTLSTNQNKPFSFRIPSNQIREGTVVNYTITATDRAGNVGQQSSQFQVTDVPQFQNVGPTTLLPDTDFRLLATITDTSGIGSVSTTYTIQQPNESPTSGTLPMTRDSNTSNIYSASFTGLPEGTIVTFDINAQDLYGNPSSRAGSFTILRSHDVNLETRDFFTQQLVNNVTVVISALTINTGSTTFTIPSQTILINGQSTIRQYQGNYAYTFSHPDYANVSIQLNVQGPTSRTVFLGGIQNTVKRADIFPRVSDDNASFFLDFEVEITDKVPVQNVRITYSIGNNLYDQNIILTADGRKVYRGTIGPFTDNVILYSQVLSVDVGDQLLVYDLGIRWYSLINVLSGTKPEICGNGLDDNNNGLVDEGCDCSPTGTKKVCSSNIGSCKVGTQTCEASGKWGLVCEGGIVPVKEICGNNVDDDCDEVIDNGCELDADGDELLDIEEIRIGTDPTNPDSDEDNVLDGQEFLYDNTDPLNSESNLLFLDVSSYVNVNTTILLSVRHPSLGTISNVSFIVEDPAGNQLNVENGENASAEYYPTAEGTYQVRASKKKYAAIKNFEAQTGLLILGPLSGAIGGSVNFFFGEEATRLPLNFLFLLFLCVIIALLSRDVFKIVHRKAVLSSEEERRRILFGIILIGGLSLIPLVIFRLFSFAAALLVSFAIIILIFGVAQLLIKASKERAIHVSDDPSKQTLVEKVLNKFRGFLFESNSKSNVPVTTNESLKQWKKVDWNFESTPEKTTSAEKEENTTTKVEAETIREPSSSFSSNETSSFSYQEPSTNRSRNNSPVEVWKKFEPVEFDDRMNEIGEQMQKALEKKLLEVGDELEHRMGKKLLEVEEDIDRRVNRRLMETEETIDRRVSRKITDLESDMQQAMEKKLTQLESQVKHRSTIRKIPTPKIGSRQKTTTPSLPKPAVKAPDSDQLAKVMQQLEVLNRMHAQGLVSDEFYTKEKGRIDVLLSKLQ